FSFASKMAAAKERLSNMSDIVDCDCAAVGWRRPDRPWREFFLGTGFHWGFLCTPANPLKLYSKHSQRQPPHFFGAQRHRVLGINDWLGIATAAMVGAQHALAMVGGLIVPPLLIVPFGTPNGDDYKRYLVQAALIVTGLMTLVQVTGIRIGGKFMWGAGVVSGWPAQPATGAPLGCPGLTAALCGVLSGWLQLSVMGVSFTSVPIVQSTLAKLMKGEGMSFDEAYGHVLGTLCVSTLTPILFSFLPIKVLRKVFPPVVSGVTILLIGIHLTGAGLANWGGGSFCSQTGNYNKLVNGVPAPVLCTGNGQVMYPYGDGHYVGMGFLVFSTIILIEILGSPFMRNCSAIIGLLFGYFIAAIIDVDGKRFVTSASFESAPAITFNWTKTFPLKFYGPAIIPLIVVSIITAIESVGDTAATIEASRMAVTDDEASLRIKGALFNDGVSGLFSALATSLPLTTFAQNNGVISLTNVAARQSGWACGLWLILLGILGKVGAFVISIPNCVLGGMTTFLFANVMSSGIKIIVSEGNLDRRTRFIMACSLALGVGVELVPQWGNYWLWPVTPDMSSGTRGIRDAIALILSTSFCLAAITAFILNLLVPEDAHDEGLAAYEAAKHASALPHVKTVQDDSHSSVDLDLEQAKSGRGLRGAASINEVRLASSQKYNHISARQAHSASHYLGFNWTKTFPLKFYGPAIIPLIVVSIITAIESVGDTAATIEASRMAVTDDEASLRIKGALFNDGVSGLFSALATSLPLTTFAQNNGFSFASKMAAAKERLSNMSDIVDCDCAAVGWRRPDRPWREFFLGTGFHWGFLCTPANPLKLYSKHSQRQPPHFFGAQRHRVLGINDWLGIATAAMVGAQHALAMVGGLIVPPLLIVPFGTPNGDDYKRYLVQAALIVTGLMTLVQVTGIRIGGKFMWGAGVVSGWPAQPATGAPLGCPGLTAALCGVLSGWLQLSVMGVSFTSVPIVQSTLAKLMKGEGMSFDEAYGHVLGTLCVSTLTPILFSFLPIKVLRKVFPPVVSGVTILLIGIHLTGAGLANWGGGSFCSQTGNYNKLVNGVPAPVLCTGNGQVMYPYGDGHYVGMGFLVFSTIILIEILGSPFMRNCSAIIGLLFGYFIAAIIDVDGKRFVTSASFESAPAITFNWTKTFPLKFYGPAIIPLIVVSIITAIESVGDTAATIEASRMAVTDDEASLRIKGALFNDGVSGLFSALATSLPLTTFAQNNGVISLTNVAARQSGWACGLWLILLGILGKVGAFVISIPNCVLGGMTTFLFANVMSSGIKIIVSEGNLDRRTRFIMACSLALGVGVELVPQWGNYWLWPVTPDMSSGTRGIRDAIALILSTSFCLAAITAFILNLLVPEDAHDEGLAAYEAAKHASALPHVKTVQDDSHSSVDLDLEQAKSGDAPAHQHITKH
ncbi:hypothetical protein QJQ45_025015, partial [Haematococcus lacustris]